MDGLRLGLGLGLVCSMSLVALITRWGEGRGANGIFFFKMIDEE